MKHMSVPLFPARPFSPYDAFFDDSTRCAVATAFDVSTALW